MTTDKASSNVLAFPKIIFGTSSLGNLYTTLPESVKMEIVANCVNQSVGKVVFDSAGKYGAGLALESLGKCLNDLKVDPENIVISNKLGWFRTELKTPEPTFETGVWKDLKYDAVQMISYDGMMKCYAQGNELLNGFVPQMVSVHDPDEYLLAAESAGDKEKRYKDILDAYRALADLKAAGKVKSVGIGSKDWRTIQRLFSDVKLDWVMIANSMTLKSHPIELIQFMTELEQKDIPIINSAVFHSGFLTGSNFYDYKVVDPGNPKDATLFKWREEFFKSCEKFNISPAVACVQFALSAPGVKSVALNTTDPKRVRQNIDMAHASVPVEFWSHLAEKRLINDYALFNINNNVQLKQSGKAC